MKDIIKNYCLNLGYQIVTMIIPFISIPYLSRVLGPNNLGIEAFTTSIIAIYISIANAGTSIYSTRQVAFLKNDKTKLIKEVYNIILFRFFLSAVSLILFIIAIRDSEYINIFMIQIIFLIGSTFFECTWYFIGKEQFKLIITRNIFIKIAGLVLILVFVNNSNDLSKYLWINAITLLVPNLTLFLILIKELGLPKSKYFSFVSLKGLIVDISPLFIMGIITQIYMNIDKVILERKNLINELGIYIQFIKSYSVFLAPITAVGTILMPKISNSVENKKKDNHIIHFSSNFIFLLCIPIIFGLLSISNDFVSMFYGDAFSNYVDLFQIGLILIFTGSLSNIVIQQVIYPNKLEGFYNLSLIISSIIRISTIVFFIDIIGIYAAIIAYIISEIFLMSFCIYKTRKRINIVKLLFNINNSKIFLSGLVMFILIAMLIKGSLVKNAIFGILIYCFMLIILKEKLILIFIVRIRKMIKK